MTKFIREVEGRDGWSRWVQPVRKGYKLACCDCALVHTMDFRIVKNKAGRSFIQFRAKRNNRSTALMRRHERQK